VCQEVGPKRHGPVDMRDRSWVRGEPAGAPWLNVEMADAFAGASVLLVEDDDIRELEADGPLRPRMRVAQPPPGGGGPGGDGRRGNGDRSPTPVELVLYVSAHSARSAAAIRTIRKAIEGCKDWKVTLTICDLSKDSSKGARDSVALTPTLVKRLPGPRTFILGHITSPELVLELLDGCNE
jgi:hypothetical protein